MNYDWGLLPSLKGKKYFKSYFPYDLWRLKNDNPLKIHYGVPMTHIGVISNLGVAGITEYQLETKSFKKLEFVLRTVYS